MTFTVTVDGPVYSSQDDRLEATEREVAEEIATWLAELYATKVTVIGSIVVVQDNTRLQCEHCGKPGADSNGACLDCQEG